MPLSRRALEKRFRAITDYPIYNYIFNLPIKKSTRKLPEAGTAVFEIALAMGRTDARILPADSVR